MKICIIGAGAAGLASAKYAIEDGFDCDVFEQTGSLGGTWVYTDCIDVDNDGFPVHTSMYKDLRTNLPKEVMAYLDFPYPEEQKKSYVYQDEVLQYFHRFVQHYNLERVIEYYSRVTHVTPIPDSKWIVEIENLRTKTKITRQFDAVIVCNGHFSTSWTPEIPGQEIFQGSQTHSRLYRMPETYRDQKVLVLGAGPSGQDISKHISVAAKEVYLSHNIKELPIKLPSNVIEKPLVKKLNKSSVTFENGTEEDIDAIMYCTGYEYNFPFLSPECGIKVEDKWVKYIYKHIINIEHPTMGFVGIPCSACIIPMCDIQARYFLASLSGKFQLPSRTEMLDYIKKYMKTKFKADLPKYAHHLGDVNQQHEYFEDLAKSGNIRPLPRVYCKLHAYVKVDRNYDDCFKLLDDESFVLLDE